MRRLIGQVTQGARVDPSAFLYSVPTATFDPEPELAIQPEVVEPEPTWGEPRLAIDYERTGTTQSFYRQSQEPEPGVEFEYERRGGGGGIWWVLLAGLFLAQ